MSWSVLFNKPYFTGKEINYIEQAVKAGKISGNGMFTQKCHTFFQERYGFKNCLLTTSCTDALEMTAILLDIKPGDEIIVPSYTFVSSALAFVRQGAKIVFSDSRKDHLGMDEDKIEELITKKTKAIISVHYAGVACDMDKIMALADKYNLFVVEDSAQAIESYYTGKDGIKKPLGSIGHFGCFSFHETKNIQCGEGGMLVINDEVFAKRAEIIWEKGTNRAEFYRGEVNKYSWVDTGSSFLPSDILAAFLFAQIEHMDEIQNKRKEIWDQYYDGLLPLADKGYFKLPLLPEYASNNGHMFYLVCNNGHERDKLIFKLKENGIWAVFHYLSLHNSPYNEHNQDRRELPESDRYSACLIRLPFFFDLKAIEIKKIIKLCKL